MAAFERSVSRIDRPEVQQGMTPQHRVRPLMPAAMRGDFAATDPFLALMEDWFPRGVFGKHPHRGIETVTYVLEGRLDHYDNQGHSGAIGPGDVQWMTAGRGLIHNEIPPEGVVVHSLQLWVNLPAADKMTSPRYQDIVGDAAPVRREPGTEIRVFSGRSDGVVSPTKNFASVTMVEFRLQPEAWVRQDLPADHNAVVILLEGAGALGAKGASVAAGDVAWLTRGDSDAPSNVAIQAGEKPLRALLYAGRPLREPVVARGPFVMNTEAEIEQAYADYRGGRFGPS
ncbi:MAG: pirin family protein [Hyphomicrobiales bacterium]|nr:pirin family protein [Hyphomicrobiales bacterium]MBV8288928.1 pirin family protein [Hyphomicrobiales bacterium]